MKDEEIKIRNRAYGRDSLTTSHLKPRAQSVPEHRTLTTAHLKKVPGSPTQTTIAKSDGTPSTGGKGPSRADDNKR